MTDNAIQQFKFIIRLSKESIRGLIELTRGPLSPPAPGGPGGPFKPYKSHTTIGLMYC